VITPRVRLGELIDDARPGFASGDRDASGVLQLRMGAVTSTGTVNWTKAVRVPAPPDVSRYWLGAGDVVFNNTNSQELVGRASLVSEASEPATFSNHITRLRCGDRLDPGFLVFWLNSRWITGFFFAFAHRWVGQSAIQVARLLDLEIPLPPLDEQRRIAARLREQLALRDSLAGQLSENQSVLDQLQRRLVEQAATIALTAPTDSIGQLTDSPPSPSVKSDGEASVIAVTSGCLTSAGWSEAGLKAARMHPARVARGTLGPGEVLVSRSNTGELVGRSAVFPGSARPIVATDLIFRLRADRTRLLPEYLAIQLQAMQLEGYWRDRSSGASSTMKKITRTQLNAVLIPLPPLADQRRIATRLREQLAEIDRAKAALEAQRKAVDALPAALLREVFGASPFGG
jgi:type I restriction enzyme, S subunit